MRISSFALSGKLHFRRIFHGESSCPTVPQSASQLLCYTIERVLIRQPLRRFHRQLHRLLCNRLHKGSLGVCDASNTPKSKCKPQNSHKPKSSSFRNLSSNEVRYKFREREKVEITVPTKSDANPTFDRDIVEVERYVQRLAQSASSKSATCVYGRRLRYYLQITSKPFHFKTQF